MGGMTQYEPATSRKSRANLAGTLSIVVGWQGSGLPLSRGGSAKGTLYTFGTINRAQSSHSWRLGLLRLNGFQSRHVLQAANMVQLLRNGPTRSHMDTCKMDLVRAFIFRNLQDIHTSIGIWSIKAT